MTHLRDNRGPIAWMVNHSVAPNLIMVLFLVGGALSWMTMKREVFPDTQEDLVEVTVAYPGASPEEVERGIVLAIEENVRALEGIKEVRSTAREGMGTVVIEALKGANLDRLAQEVKSEVDRIRTFPEEAEKPDIAVASSQRQVLIVQISGDMDPRVLREYAEEARDEFVQHPNITQVELSGVPPLEIAVEISQENLRRYNLTLPEVAARLRAASVELPGGEIKTRGGDIMVRVKERRDWGREFERLPIITAADGAEVLLGDIATVKDGFEEVDLYATLNGRPAISMSVFRVGDETPERVSDATRECIETLRQRFPEQVHFDIDSDRAETYRDRMRLLLRNGLIGGMLVMALLGVFLEMRLAFWVMLGIPISFMGAALLMPTLGISLNMMSMFAFIVALGIVVDDAIVIGENIYYHHEQGRPLHQAAIDGARELALPVTFSILTNVAAFMPIAYIPGVMGRMFWMIPIVVVAAFMVSLIESLFVLPSHLAHQSDAPRHGRGGFLHRAQQAFGRGFTRAVNVVFGPVLDRLLSHRYLVLSAAVALLLIVGAWPLSGRMGFEMFPSVESEFARASVILPFGSPVHRTEAIVDRLTRAARKVAEDSGHPELAGNILAIVGEGGGHRASIQVFLAPAEVRDKIMSVTEFVDRWREATGPVHGVDALSYAADSGGPGGRGAGLTVELSHRSMAVLEEASTALAEALSNYPIVRDINDGFQPGKPQIDFQVNAEGKSLGLTAQEVARQVRSAFYGAEAMRQQRGRNEVKIMARLPKAERVSEFTLEQLILRTPAGIEVPLREVVEMQRGNAYTAITRREGRRAVQVEAEVTPRSRAVEVLAAVEENDLPGILRRYPGLSYSFEGRQAEMRDSMSGLWTGFAVALIIVFALLAIPFRSYIQPLIIMTSIPFGIIGAILGHLAMGYPLSIMSMFGIVALSGVVVNGSLVLIDSANRRHRAGETPHDAVLAASIQRFRPILLTTLTTFCGISPMIFERSRQAQFLIPMALSLGFGILFAAFISLIIVPCLYLVTEDAKRTASAFWAFLRGREPAGEEV